MYSDLLTPKEKPILLMLLQHLAASDGIVHPHEAEFIEASPRVLGVQTDGSLAPPALENVMKALDTVTSSRAKRIMLMELINIAYADGDYCDTERADVGAFAERLAVPRDDLAEIEAWVTQGVAWTLKGQQLFLEEP